MNVVVCGVDCTVEDDTVFAVVDGVFVDLACILFESFSTTNDAVIAVNDDVLENNMSFAVGLDSFGTVGDDVTPDEVIISSALIEDLNAYTTATNSVLVDSVEVCAPEVDAEGVRVYDCVIIECIVVCWFGDADSIVGYIVLKDFVMVRVHDYACVGESVAEYRGI